MQRSSTRTSSRPGIRRGLSIQEINETIGDLYDGKAPNKRRVATWGSIKRRNTGNLQRSGTGSLRGSVSSRRPSNADLQAAVDARKKWATMKWGKVQKLMGEGYFKELDADNAPRAKGGKKAIALKEEKKPSGWHAVERWLGHAAPRDLFEDEDDDRISEDDDSETEKVGLASLYLQQKRRSTLGVVQTCRVLRHIPTRLQVRFSRQLRRAFYGGNGPNGQVLFTAGSNDPEQNKIIIIEQGLAELVVQGKDGSEIVVGQFGPGHVFGGLLALGLVSKHFMTVRVAQVQPGDAEPSRGFPSDQRAGSKDHHSHHEHHQHHQHHDGSAMTKTHSHHAREREEIADRPTELSVLEISAAELTELESGFREELRILKRRILQDLRQNLMPKILQVMQFGAFFRRYRPDFVKRLAEDLNLRIFKPGELIFKERSPAKSLAILFAGKIDVFINGKFLTSYSGCGFEFGEAALLDEGPLRTATVRCSQDGECMICLMHTDVFASAFEEFPEERDRLEDQVRTRLTQLTLKDIFPRCDQKFLLLLSTLCEVVTLPWGKKACEAGKGEEAMHVVYMGAAVVERPDTDEPSVSLPKGVDIGAEAAIGLRSGPPDYNLLPGGKTCVLIRVSYEQIERALTFFPQQLAPLLASVNVFEVPEDHPFRGKEVETLEVAQKLLCQAFMTLDIDMTHCRALMSCFQTGIYEQGTTITEEGQECSDMILLLDGDFTWKRKELTTAIDQGPRHFDEGVIMGIRRRREATITATSTCVVWHLPLAALSNVIHGAAAPVWPIIKQAREQRQTLQTNLQARLRNMKNFRRFRSEILALISKHLDIRTFLPGQTIFEAGDSAEHMFIILRGRVQAESNGKVNFLDEGATFGEMVLFGQLTRTITVRAVNLCICNVVHKDFISHAFNIYPDDPATAVTFTSAEQRPPNQAPKRAKGTEERVVVERGTKKGLNKLKAVLSSSRFRVLKHRSTLGLGDDGDEGTEPDERDTRMTFASAGSGMPRPSFSSATSGEGVSNTPSGRTRSGTVISGTISVGPMIVEGVDESRTTTIEEGLPSVEMGSSLGHSLEHPQSAMASDPGGARQLWERFQHRSCVFDMQAPKVPSADYALYATPRGAEEKLSEAFQHLVPGDMSVTRSHMNGIRRIGSPSTRSRQLLSQQDSLMHDSSISSVGRRHFSPTYTTPLPPLSKQQPTDVCVQPAVRPKEAEQGVAMAGHLQVLASSLLRINTKPHRSDDFYASTGEWPELQGPARPESQQSQQQAARRKRVARMCRHYLPKPPSSPYASLSRGSSATTRLSTAPTSVPTRVSSSAWGSLQTQSPLSRASTAPRQASRHARSSRGVAGVGSLDLPETMVEEEELPGGNRSQSKRLEDIQAALAHFDACLNGNIWDEGEAGDSDSGESLREEDMQEDPDRLPEEPGEQDSFPRHTDASLPPLRSDDGRESAFSSISDSLANKESFEQIAQASPTGSSISDNIRTTSAWELLHAMASPPVSPREVSTFGIGDPDFGPDGTVSPEASSGGAFSNIHTEQNLPMVLHSDDAADSGLGDGASVPMWTVWSDPASSSELPPYSGTLNEHLLTAHDDQRIKSAAPSVHECVPLLSGPPSVNDSDIMPLSGPPSVTELAAPTWSGGSAQGARSGRADTRQYLDWLWCRLAARQPAEEIAPQQPAEEAAPARASAGSDEFVPRLPSSDSLPPPPGAASQEAHASGDASAGHEGSNDFERHSERTGTTHTAPMTVRSASPDLLAEIAAAEGVADAIALFVGDVLSRRDGQDAPDDVGELAAEGAAAWEVAAPAQPAPPPGQARPSLGGRRLVASSPPPDVAVAEREP